MPAPFQYHLISSRYRHAAVAGVSALTLLLTATVSNAQSGAGPFANLGGAWSGSGQLTFADGRTERVRCRADYSVGGGGNAIEQSLRCASDSYNFELRSNAQSRGGQISGTWSEATRGLSGNLHGQASGGHINVRADAGTMSVALSLTSSGNQQSVTLRPQGQTDITGASIQLTRRGGDGSRTSGMAR